MSSVPVPWPQEDLSGKISLGANDTAPMKSSFSWQAQCADLRALTFYPGVFGLGPYFCSEINYLHFLNATKGTFKCLFPSLLNLALKEPVPAVARYKFANAPTKLFDASSGSVSNSISKESRKVSPM